MAVDDKIRQTLATSRVVDLTSTGRKSGQPHRMEIPIFNVDGRLFIVGDPRTHDDKRELRPRDWYANLVADSRCTLHLKTTFRIDLRASHPYVIGVLDYENLIDADVPAVAKPMKDRAVRQRVLGDVLQRLRGSNMPGEVADWVEHAPMVEVELVEAGSPA
jgi:hypothetical protein